MKRKSVLTLAGAIALTSAATVAQDTAHGPAVQVDPFRPTPLLEKRAYIKNLTQLAHHFAGEERGWKMQMMAVGDRRYLVQSDWVIDVSDPMKPEVVTKGRWRGTQLQLAFNDRAQKWVLVVSDGGGRAQPGASKPNRGVSIFDISDPREPRLLSQFANATGTHRNYYDGGRYAYLTGSPDETYYTDRSAMWGGTSGAMQVVDLEDPAAPKLVTTWHVPGQRAGEDEARKLWSSYRDRSAMNSLHGPVYVPKRVEDGGRLAYSPWGQLGMLIHDVSDPAYPKLLSRWEPERYVSGMGGMAFHTIEVSRLDRGFVITNPEVFWPQCRYDWHDSHVVDVSDPARPRKLATLPVPVPPPEAPYRSFCDRYGRFGAHNPPHLKAPGKVHPDFTCYSYFAAGLQCYDLTNPRDPRITAYFVPEQGGEHTHWEPLSGPMSESIRTVDNVFIEWDRRLIWVASDSGLYLLSSPVLGKPLLAPMPVREWTLPSINRGWDRFRGG